ncbi:SPP1 family phage portal protein [Peptoniphilus ivorii]|uniref:phage portal protein n=1 Tax=Aedoeadaptatus ivorii TaxID=54006 RepID=UPI001E299755|nr:phage portal protein [Peptoniphilus ivorii]MDQ0507638.1 SPP1 family phage portal protein [Peptoniphilus ivorii]
MIDAQKKNVCEAKTRTGTPCKKRSNGSRSSEYWPLLVTWWIEYRAEARKYAKKQECGEAWLVCESVARRNDGAYDLIVEFMDKPDGDATQEHLINRLETLIFNLSMVANINDKDFGASSGIALRYKLQSMSNLANTKERKFTKGFRRRYRLIAVLANTAIAPEDLAGLHFIFTRNTPANLLEEAQTANLLTGLVSDETALNSLSIIKDAKAEMKRIQEEEAPLPTFDAEMNADE